MLREFLRTSSIHGVKYLVESKSAVAKLAWLVCILSCFTSAIVIIYYNVAAWENSPAVISQARPMLVKVTLSVASTFVIRKEISILF